ncbi:MAG: MarR family transcriptional regulator [Sneathiellales bacterium]|nr:MarR family transcriptional regulator [Sneathiellales bacterium]
MTQKAVSLYDVIRQIRPAFRNISKVVEQRSELFGLTVGTRAVLEMLFEQGKQTVPEMASRLDVERQYIQRCVNELMEDARIEKLVNPAHKRSYLYSVTPSGRKTFSVLKQAETRILGDISTQLSLEEIEGAIKVMRCLAVEFKSLSHVPSGE